VFEQLGECDGVALIEAVEKVPPLFDPSLDVTLLRLAHGPHRRNGCYSGKRSRGSG